MKMALMICVVLVGSFISRRLFARVKCARSSIYTCEATEFVNIPPNASAKPESS